MKNRRFFTAGILPVLREFCNFAEADFAHHRTTGLKSSARTANNLTESAETNNREQLLSD